MVQIWKSSEDLLRIDPMPELIRGPSYVDKTDGGPKFCDTYRFPVRPMQAHVHLSHLRCAGGWAEPEEVAASGLDQCVLVLRGLLRVEHGGGMLDVRAGDGVLVRAGERMRSSTPEPAGAELIVVALGLRPGFPAEGDDRDRG
jgi:hypothetical protein